MPLIPRSPFWDLDWFFGEWPEKLLPEVPAVRHPRMDIYESNGNIVAEIELPGVDPKNIDITVEDNMFSVEAKGETKKEKKKKGYYRRELSKTYYKRTVPLPVKVKGEEATASYEDGVLKVTIPKVEPTKEKKKKGIKVEVKTKTA